MVEQVEFKDFRIGELFEIKSTKKVVHSDSVELHNDKTSKEKSPYVVRSALNNGIRGYSEVEDSWLNPGNSISFAQDTFSVFYQEEPYFTGNKVKVMELKGRKLNGKIALYFVSLISKAFSGYGWSTGSTSQEILNKKIPLPVTSSGSINYSYMESYISYIEKLHVANIQQAHILRIEQTLKELGYNSLKDVELTQEDKEILRLFSEGEKLTLAEFKIGELFDIFCVHPQMQKSDFVYGSSDKTYPLIMQNKDNNGVEAFIPKQENEKISLVGGNKITMFTHLNRAFYQPKDFYCKQGGNIYILDNENLNKNNALYFCSLIDKAIQDVGYGKNTKHTFLNKKIPLPINPQSPETPNYSLMESYITAIEKLHVNKLISSHTKEITALNTVI